MDERFAHMSDKMDERFAHMSERFADMDHRITDVHASIADVHKAIAVQTRWFLAAAATIAALYPLIQQLAARLVGG